MEENNIMKKRDHKVISMIGVSEFEIWKLFYLFQLTSKRGRQSLQDSHDLKSPGFSCTFAFEISAP